MKTLLEKWLSTLKLLHTSQRKLRSSFQEKKRRKKSQKRLLQKMRS
jgi:hypothetical protein